MFQLYTACTCFVISTLAIVDTEAKNEPVDIHQHISGELTDDVPFEDSVYDSDDEGSDVSEEDTIQAADETESSKLLQSAAESQTM